MPVAASPHVPAAAEQAARQGLAVLGLTMISMAEDVGATMGLPPQAS